MKQDIFINHIGFLVNQQKTLVVKSQETLKSFEVQDMAQIELTPMGEDERWKTIFKGELIKEETDFGIYYKGDFSSLKVPGHYRVVIPKSEIISYTFNISDGVFHLFPYLFLDFIHHWRSGFHQDELRGFTHLDDAVRSDTGEQLDLIGGWYDAGDLRKWMVHSTLPALGFLDLYKNLNLQRNYFHEEQKTKNDFITETIWGLDFISKMQDPNTGMIYEDIGGGGTQRKTAGMSWWYENHAGCLGDNSDNRFTDNIPNSGDERKVRVQYNPIAQYTNIYILLRSLVPLEQLLSANQKSSIKKYKSTALFAWEYLEKNECEKDAYHQWTSVTSWRLLALIELWKINEVNDSKIIEAKDNLLSLFEESIGFWCMDAKKNDPYRGILHSAQPIIALCKLINEELPFINAEEIIGFLKTCNEKYIKPLMATNAFGFMPYGTFFKPPNNEDHFRSIKLGDSALFYRFFMPDKSVQRINHGLSGHWMSWAHGLALLGNLLKDEFLISSAWNQLNWLLGANPFNVCMISGTGYNNLQPHSRGLGTYPGGFCNGFIGNYKDEIFLDIKKKVQWNTTEYWNTPLSNCMMALSELLPKEINSKNKLGYK